MPADKLAPRVQDKIDQAKKVAELLRAQGSHYEAEVVLKVCRSLIATNRTLKASYADNQALRDHLKALDP